MKKQELIERIENLKNLFGNKYEYVKIDFVIELASELDELQPLKLKEVIKRIKGFDVGTQKVWLNEILNELGSDYGNLKYKAGYEQGKLDGEWVGQQLKNADKIRQELNKPTIPQFVADWIEKTKNELSLSEAMSQGYAPHELDSWLREMDQDGACFNQELFARAWLDGYTVEEKRYTVKIKAVDQYLVSAKDENFLGFLQSKLRTYFTRKELEDAGFGWVFDCPGIEIEEVEE